MIINDSSEPVPLNPIRNNMYILTSPWRMSHDLCMSGLVSQSRMVLFRRVWSIESTSPRIMQPEIPAPSSRANTINRSTENCGKCKIVNQPDYILDQKSKFHQGNAQRPPPPFNSMCTLGMCVLGQRETNSGASLKYVTPLPPGGAV